MVEAHHSGGSDSNRESQDRKALMSLTKSYFRRDLRQSSTPRIDFEKYFIDEITNRTRSCFMYRSDDSTDDEMKQQRLEVSCASWFCRPCGIELLRQCLHAKSSC